MTKVYMTPVPERVFERGLRVFFCVYLEPGSRNKEKPATKTSNRIRKRGRNSRYISSVGLVP